MRAVLDTVIFVRALINPHGQWGRLLFDPTDRYTLVLSPDVIKEIISVLYRPSSRQRVPQMAEPAQLRRVLAVLEQAEVIEPGENVSVCRDPHDDKFCACALAGRARYIVTADKDILAVGAYRGIRPITAAAFIAVLQRS